MRKLLLAGVIALAPLAAFAGDPGQGSVSGDVNLSKTEAGSTAGVTSKQGTGAGVSANGNGGVAVGAVSGNSTDVHTGASAANGPTGSVTDTTAHQTNIGGTVAGGVVYNKSGRGEGTSGSAGGGQSSTATGTSAATATDTNIGGFIKEPTSGHHSGGGGGN